MLTPDGSLKKIVLHRNTSRCPSHFHYPLTFCLLINQGGVKLYSSERHFSVMSEKNVRHVNMVHYKVAIDGYKT